MSAFEIGLVGCGSAPFAALFVLLVALSLTRRSRHRDGMERYRASCRSLGLRQMTHVWAGEIEGIHVGTSWAQHRVLDGGSTFEDFTRYIARIEPPLRLDLHAFKDAVLTLDGRDARIVSWRRRPLPQAVALVPDPYGAALHVHAADPIAAEARLSAPHVVAALQQALATSDDLLIRDDQVELLAAPYEDSPEELGRRLRIAAALARALTA